MSEDADPRSRRFTRLTRVIVLLGMVLALLPLGRIATDWWQLRSYAGDTMPATAGAFDWVIWGEEDGQIVAQHVFPRGPGARGGLMEGDRFYMLEYQQFFGLDDLQNVIRGMAPGSTPTYLVERNGRYIEAPVTYTRYPTFLYPKSRALWQFALWAFGIGAFFHVLALFVAAPLARHSREARFEFLLIGVSAAWVFGNLLRLVLVELLGPPSTGTGYDVVFQALTLIGLIGWVGFPSMLLFEVVQDALEAVRQRASRILIAVVVPPGLLSLVIFITVIAGHWGPVTLENLLVPILFMASCYIASASLIVLIMYRTQPDAAELVFRGWGRAGSAVIAGASTLAALAVIGIFPVLGSLTDVEAGWLVVSAQLLAVVPVTLFSLGTLRHGKIDEVLSRALVYTGFLGLIFFAAVAGLSLLDPYLADAGISRNVIAGLYIVVLLLVFDRMARRLRGVATMLFRSERHKALRTLARFQEQMRDILDADALAQQTIDTVAAVFDVRSAVLFCRRVDPDSGWIRAAHHPEPPYLTERVFHEIWPRFEDDSRVWARNPELDERHLPAVANLLLKEHGAALAVPIRGDHRSVGLLVLGVKRPRRAVYNLEDLELLRSLSGQLALAIERLTLIEREKGLARQTSEAQLVALRAQINPHFLFNALNAIAAHIDEKPDTAESSVEHLAAMFRHTLQLGDHAFISLSDEMALVGHYLAVEQARFGDRLTVEIRVAAGAEQHFVPAFVVQTLVENAVKHGIERKRGGGSIVIQADRDSDEAIRIVVRDTGAGIPALFGPDADPTSVYGLGLSNVSKRLELLFGRSDLLRLTSNPDVGTSAHLLIPTAGEPVQSH